MKTKTTAEKMRDLAFNNKEVIKIYNEALTEIEYRASDGELYSIVDRDETVIELLLLDGFKITVTDGIGVKVSW